MNVNDKIFKKQELENKLKGFQAGKDYSVSSVENGKQVYNIHSDELKKALGSNLVYCRIEKYDGQDFRYQGHFKGYKNGSFHTSQTWWRGENFNPEEHPKFSNFDEDWENFLSQLDPSVRRSADKIGNVFKKWGMKNNFQKASQEEWKTEKESGIKISVRFSRPFTQLSSDDYQTCQCKSTIKRTVPGDNNLCLECGKMLKGVNRENTRNACFDCGKLPAMIRADHAEAGRNSAHSDGNFRCNECNTKYINCLQEKLTKESEKSQQITSLQEQLNQKKRQLTESSQQLETERRAKEKVERNLEASKIQQKQAQNELIQLREELVKVRQELTQAQERLKEQMEKFPQANTEQLIEKLEKSGKDLTTSQKLIEKPKFNHQEIIEVKNQLDSSRRILAAAAAHTKSIEQAPQLQTQVKSVKVHEQPKTNYLPYLISGLFISGLGLFIWQKKKASKKINKKK